MINKKEFDNKKLKYEKPELLVLSNITSGGKMCVNGTNNLSGCLNGTNAGGTGLSASSAGCQAGMGAFACISGASGATYQGTIKK